VKARYYGFDVTPEKFITNFITEKGIIEKPFKKYIKMLFETQGSMPILARRRSLRSQA